MRFAYPLLALSLLATPAIAQTTGTMTPPATATPAAPPAGTSSPVPSTAPMTPPAPAKSSRMSSGSTGGVTHYASLSAATSACGSDTVVWASPRSKALHTSDSSHFGKTKSGFYACEKDAMAGGYHMAGTAKKHAK